MPAVARRRIERGVTGAFFPPEAILRLPNICFLNLHWPPG